MSGLKDFFLAKIFKTETPSFHQPQDNFETLSKIKFLRQIVTADSRKSRVLMWNSDTELKNIQLEYKLIGENAAQFANTEKDFFGKNFIYSCTLENLKPESLYLFRIVAEDCATNWQNLRTSGHRNFQMLIFSDSQCFNYDVWQRTADTAAKNFPDAEIIVVDGDLVDCGQDLRQWQAWHNASQNLLAEKIFVPVMGNHECYDMHFMDSLPEGYLHNFKLPPNGTKKLGGYFYNFDYGAASFFVLNTQFHELQNFLGDIRDAQEYFFRCAVADSYKRWKIVLMHKPIFNRALNGFVEEAEKYFIPLFEELKIDLVISGHFHKYRNSGNIRGTHYIICGRAGDQNYTRTPETFLSLDVRAYSINVICQTVDGEILDNFSLEKKN